MHNKHIILFICIISYHLPKNRRHFFSIAHCTDCLLKCRNKKILCVFVQKKFTIYLTMPVEVIECTFLQDLLPFLPSCVEKRFLYCTHKWGWKKVFLLGVVLKKMQKPFRTRLTMLWCQKNTCERLFYYFSCRKWTMSNIVLNQIHISSSRTNHTPRCISNGQSDSSVHFYRPITSSNK